MPAMFLIALALLAIPDPALAQAACPDMTTLQRWAGYLSWVGFLQILGIGLGAAGIIFVFYGVIKQIAHAMRYAIETFAYIASALLIASGHIYSVPGEFLLWPVMTGCITFAASVFYTLWLHKIKGDDPRTLYTLFMVVWGAVAIFYGQSAIGFLAVLAFIGILGFSIGIGPLSYAFGYERKAQIPGGTMAALMLLSAYVLAHLFWKDAPMFVRVFMPGALWLGSFVAFIGILILSSSFYDDDDGRFWVMQLVAWVVYGAFGMLGLIYDIVPLPAMALTLFAFYLASKPLDFEWEQSPITVGISLLMASAVFGTAWFFATSNAAMARHFIAMVQ